MINIEGRAPTHGSGTTFLKSPPIPSLQSNNGQEVHVKIKWPKKKKKFEGNNIWYWSRTRGTTNFDLEHQGWIWYSLGFEELGLGFGGE